jgi:hypothetical protein
LPGWRGPSQGVLEGLHMGSSELQYGQAVARAILEVAAQDEIGTIFRIDDKGVWVDDPGTALHAWHPAMEISVPGSPDPLSVPSLPFPFTARELAAFAMSGMGRFISETFFGDGPFEAENEGPWGNDPKHREEMLARLEPRATKAREVLDAAYVAYGAAQGSVPPIDQALIAKDRQPKGGLGAAGKAEFARWRRAVCRALLLDSPNAGARAPSWHVWGNVPEVMLWQAVALSMAIDPRRVAFASNEWMAGSTERLFSEGPEFEDRMLVARAAVGHAFLRAQGQPVSDDEIKVQLAAFGTWAESKGWRLPEEFPRDRSAELAKWKREDLWSERDLQDLCCGLMPNGSRPNTAEVNKAAEAICRAILAGALTVASEPVDATAGDRMYAHARFFRPRDAAAWAIDKKFEKFPFKLDDFDAPAGTTARTWPWGEYKTSHLDHLAAAIEKWWVRYDPSDSTTAPTNAQVVTWLKQRGVTQSMAEKMASMMRADNLPTGPRRSS